MALSIARKLPIIEPIPIPDTICSAGCPIIQNVGYGARFVVCNQETVYEVGADQLVVKAKIILPWVIIWPCIGYAARFMVEQSLDHGAKSLRVAG